MAADDAGNDAANRLVSLAGLSKDQADALVKAALQAAEDQTLKPSREPGRSRRA